VKRRCFSCFRVFVFFVMARAGMPVAHAQVRDIEVRTSLDQTAMWVADHVTYTITIVCKKGVDILADDLSKDKLHVEGLEIVGSDSNRVTDRDDRTTSTFSYELTAYRVDLPELKIAPLTVRYYVKRAGQRIGDAAPAGEAQVPPAVVAFRSALPDGQDTYAIRDGRGVRPRRLRYAWLQPIGLALVLLSVVPAGVVAVDAIRRSRPREKPRSARQVRHDERASLDALGALDLSTAAGRHEAYTRLNALIRDHVHYAAGVEAASLTPEEIDVALAGRDERVPAELVSAVLAACDRARYAPPNEVPSIDACRTAIAQAAQVLGS
jgi:hypothetical protein